MLFKKLHHVVRLKALGLLTEAAKIESKQLTRPNFHGTLTRIEHPQFAWRAIRHHNVHSVITWWDTRSFAPQLDAQKEKTSQPTTTFSRSENYLNHSPQICRKIVAGSNTEALGNPSGKYSHSKDLLELVLDHCRSFVFVCVLTRTRKKRIDGDQTAMARANPKSSPSDTLFASKSPMDIRSLKSK